MKTICFYNHKGGVGKTTLTAAIAGELICNNKKVIIIDIDTQANLTNHLCKGQKIENELADYLYNDNQEITNFIYKTNYNGLYVIPTKKLSAGGRLDKWARGEATEVENRNAIINLIKKINLLEPDYVLFDMPPSYSELDKKVLLASDEVIPVLQLDKYSIDGLSDFFLLLSKLKCGDEKPVLSRLIFNCYDKRKSIQKSLLKGIEELSFKQYLVPTDETFKKAAEQGRMIQAMKNVKPTTSSVLAEIAKDIMEGN